MAARENERLFGEKGEGRHVDGALLLFIVAECVTARGTKKTVAIGYRWARESVHAIHLRYHDMAHLHRIPLPIWQQLP
ncbi:hypothetical protein B0I21_101598 [Sphingobacterium paludis]|uniref:Uncharacterized protein n=1 Tax=Sphingobacterium paludis TaxID=1476465 RepID=A0A4R7DA90_9SPHI|nr:hypothetical protein B0I21_101598 [Sphingobacterium paludis]